MSRAAVQAPQPWGERLAARDRRSIRSQPEVKPAPKMAQKPVEAVGGLSTQAAHQAEQRALEVNALLELLVSRQTCTRPTTARRLVMLAIADATGERLPRELCRRTEAFLRGLSGTPAGDSADQESLEVNALLEQLITRGGCTAARSFMMAAIAVADGAKLPRELRNRLESALGDRQVTLRRRALIRQRERFRGLLNDAKSDSGAKIQRWVEGWDVEIDGPNAFKIVADDLGMDPEYVWSIYRLEPKL